MVALALLAQATNFGPKTLSFALPLISVALLIGIATFVRSVAINYEDARWVTGMNLLRHAYLKMVPDLANSLTTTSSVVAVLNSVLFGCLASDVSALLGAGLVLVVALGASISLVSGAFHVLYAARFRQSHVPSTLSPR